MRRLAWLAMAVMFLGGCARWQHDQTRFQADMQALQERADDQRCQDSAGLRSSPAYFECRLKLVKSRQQSQSPAPAPGP